MNSANAALLKAVAARLGPMLPDLVFVGGQVTELLVSNPAAVRIRVTRDVDVVVPSATRLAHGRLEARLRELGFNPDTTEGAPICRWRSPEGFLLDAMPVSPEPLGFTNRWYELAMARSITMGLGEGIQIRIPEPPVFLGTKWEAFLGRGRRDLLASPDLEDVLAIFAGRREIVREARETDPDLRVYLAERCDEFLRNQDRDYAVQSAVPDAGASPAVLDQILDRIRAVAALAE